MIIDAAPTIDGAIDAPIDAAIDTIPPDAQACFGTLPRICFATLPTSDVVIANGRAVDTHASSMCNQNHDQADKDCVIAGASVAIPTGIVGPKVVIRGQVNASGGHGGGRKTCGGGGGGAGGMIVIDSPSIMRVGTATVFANGGGAQGGEDKGGGEGADGGEALNPLTAGIGGKTAGRNGGGNGAAGTGSKDGDTAVNAAGDNSGGGASGSIRAPGVTSPLVAPTPE